MHLAVAPRLRCEGEATVISAFVPDIQFRIITEQASAREPRDIVVLVEAIGIAEPSPLILDGVLDPGEHAFAKMQDCNPVMLVSRTGLQSVGFCFLGNSAPVASRLFDRIGCGDPLAPTTGKQE